MRYPFTIDGFEGQDLAVELPGLFGAPRLVINGQPAPAGENSREFLLTHPKGGSLTVRLELSKLGSLLSVAIGDVSVPLMKPLAWYEWTWNVLPFVLVIGGGAVGGLLGGVAAMLNLRLFRSLTNPLSRYALTATISLAALVSYLVVVGGINLAFGNRPTDLVEKSGSPASRASSGSSAKPVAARARSFVLPQDWKALQEVCQAEMKGADRRDLFTLQLGRVLENVSITVPAGLILQPFSPETKAGAYLTRRPEVFSSAPTSGAGWKMSACRGLKIFLPNPARGLREFKRGARGDRGEDPSMGKKMWGEKWGWLWPVPYFTPPIFLPPCLTKPFCHRDTETPGTTMGFRSRSRCLRVLVVFPPSAAPEAAKD